MSSGAKKKREKVDVEGTEGWEALAEEPEGSLGANPELEEALREAAEAVDESGEVRLVEVNSDESYDEELGRLREDLIQANDRFLRLQADFENFRRRSAKEKEELARFGHENLVKDLLSTVDNLDRAIDHAQLSDSGDLESLLQGVELLQREFYGILGTHDVSEVVAEGKIFDPAVHEAMAQVADDTVAPNTVLEVLQKGYQLRGRLLRPTRVVVAKPTAAAEKSKVAEEETE
jgi:molecular chaperone GrpE